MGYLLANPSFKLHFRAGGSSGLDSYADADWGNSKTRRSTTGMMARYNKGLIYWKSLLDSLLPQSASANPSSPLETPARK